MFIFSSLSYLYFIFFRMKCERRLIILNKIILIPIVCITTQPEAVNSYRKREGQTDRQRDTQRGKQTYR